MKGIKNILNSPEEVSKTIIKLIEQKEQKNASNDQREIKIVSVHGHRNRDSLPSNVLVKHFVRCIKNNWQFHEVTGIYSGKRLKTKIDICNHFEGAQGYILKAYLNVNGLTILNPIFIGKDDVLLGIDDPIVDTVSRAIHIKGEKNIQFFKIYFDELWKAPDCLVLRDRSGIQYDVVKKLKDMLHE
jgi:hypothetical protein